MNTKQTIFVNEYLKCWNASEAARRAGYNGKSNVQGPRLLADDSIKAAIKERIEEIKMSADEVLIRLAVMARANMADFAYIRDSSDIAKLGDTAGVIKKFKKRVFDTPIGEREDIEIELYDAQAALEKLGRYHNLFKETQTNFNIDLTQLSDAQLQRLAAGEEPLTVLATTESES